MKLSTLVRSKQSIDNLSVNDVVEALNKLKHKTEVTKHNFNFNDDAWFSELDKSIDSVLTSINSINEVIAQFKIKIDNEITAESQKYCYRGAVNDGIPVADKTSVSHERDVRMTFYDDETNFNLISKIRDHTSPRFPALEIGPGDGQWTKHRVAADPLYLVDLHPEFLDSAVAQFPEAYQRRVRKYLVDADGVGDLDYSRLPQNQFGFILSVNVFEYYTLDAIKILINQCFSLLRPGGVLLFTYNNSEEYKCAEFVDKGYRSWAPKKLVVDICQQAGFEIISSMDNTSLHYLEIRKPGELKTVKTNQALGEISRRVA